MAWLTLGPGTAAAGRIGALLDREEAERARPRGRALADPGATLLMLELQPARPLAGTAPQWYRLRIRT